jgi:two-component system OmpR family response regulator
MKILVVEDDINIAQAVKDGLEREFFAVDIASDGEIGLATASAEEYDLIVLDLMLPGMNGVEMTRRLRAEKSQSRILVLSARDQTIDKIEALNTGVDDYLVKPFSFEELVARIKALLRRPEDRKGEILNAHDLRLNTITREIWRGDVRIELSAREFAILRYLLHNKGMVLSKNNIMSHVWDFDADIIPHTVESFIAALRIKIEKPFAGPPIIHTVRGIGYKIDNV